MGSIPGQFPISLRAWPSKDDNAVPLSSLISRISNERVSFREVTEESLTDELKSGEAGLELSKDDDDSEGEDIEEEPDRLKELMKARGEILGQLEEAHNAAGFTLDFVSLLLSKDTPVQASLSISPPLRDAVALGTLGADKLQDSRVTKAQKHDNRRVAKGWKLQGITDSVDSILSSAARLEKEIEKETQYWEQVLAVSGNGWAICRLPQERHTLGVRFGFAESAPAFNNRSLGALRRDVDGTISLDHGTADSTPKRVRIRIQTNRIITGESSLSEPFNNPSSIESSILVARNTIFEEELWQELNREARILANQGVRVIGDEIVCGLKGSKQIVIDLQPAKDNELQRKVAGSNGDDILAEVISLSLRLLLSYAHRQNHHRRSRPPPTITIRPPPRLPYNLLRPVIMRLNHEAVMFSLTSLLTPLSEALISAGMCDAAHTLTTASVASTIDAKAKSTKHPPPFPEQAIDALISHISAEVTVPLSRIPFPSQSLTIQILTLLPTLETRFRITVTGPLNIFCKPPPNPSTVDEVKAYVLWATSCALAGAFVDASDPDCAEEVTTETDQVNSRSVDNQKGEDDWTYGLRGWQLTHNPTVLRKSFKNEKDSKELAFKVNSIVGEHSTVKIKAAYKFVNGQQLVGGENRVITRVWSETARDSPAGRQSGPKQEPIQLKQFVESVGKWNQPPLDTTNELGDGYEQTGFDWA